MERVFTKRIENMFWHKYAYEERVVSSVKNRLKMMLAGLDNELRAGRIPADFKVRVDAAYQEIMGERNYIHDPSQLLTAYYEAYCEYHAGIYNAYDKAEWIEKISIITRIEDMTARLMNNLTADMLGEFVHDVLKQLNNVNINLDDTYQLLYNTRDEAIEKFEKLERGSYNIHHTAFESS
jgi:hypothetical protein